jgi:putative endonuclease
LNHPPTTDSGRQGEDAALAHLESKGLILLCRNFRRRFGEIDLVMRERDCIVFVEVRVRRHSDFGDGFNSVTRGKRLRLWRTASAYLQSHPGLAALPSRFDLVSVSTIGSEATCDWLIDAFTADI